MHEISVHMKAAQENGYSNPNEAENLKIFQPSRCHHKGAVSGGGGGGRGGGVKCLTLKSYIIAFTLSQLTLSG